MQDTLQKRKIDQVDLQETVDNFKKQNAQQMSSITELKNAEHAYQQTILNLKDENKLLQSKLDKTRA